MPTISGITATHSTTSATADVTTIKCNSQRPGSQQPIPQREVWIS
ncbi:15907_t:CDS:2 [Funneliformis mosseae]|uniref:15907_t:CDS:1 n=1 Tax=Funneliformis mosseae TaxID=27381 RepID=A0A9N9GQG0_FUNMO|nr:15907_t:CDS:2 [Funneliformis mosseae]